MEVEDIMVQKVATINTAETVKVAVKLMNQHEIGCLIAVESSKIVGIITERDLLKKVLEESKDPTKLKVREIMSKKLVVGVPTMEITDAVRLMLKNNVKKLPIVVEGQLIGLITLTRHRSSSSHRTSDGEFDKGAQPRRMTALQTNAKVLDYYIS